MCRCYFASYSSMGLKQFLNSDEYIGFWNHFYVLLHLEYRKMVMRTFFFCVLRYKAFDGNFSEIFQQTNKIVS